MAGSEHTYVVVDLLEDGAGTLVKLTLLGLRQRGDQCSRPERARGSDRPTVWESRVPGFSTRGSGRSHPV